MPEFKIYLVFLLARQINWIQSGSQPGCTRLVCCEHYLGIEQMQTETVSRSPAAALAHPPSLWTKFAYGFGSVAYGIKNNGFDYFLLLFYSQVVGLDARLVGFAITIALIADAVTDPLVGYWSDNLRSKWGRRHPFMYASAVPVAATFFMLWNPPEDLSQVQLFWFLLLMAVMIRTFITLYETPSSALAPDMTQDYDHRSALISWRYYFGWTGGNAMTTMMFFFIFPAFVTSTISDGQFNRDAYRLYGIIGSCGILFAILLSSIGTHSRIPFLTQPPPKRSLTLGKIFKEIFVTLSEPDFFKLFISALFGAIATGLAGGLSFYFLTYFWGFDSIERGQIVLGTFAAAGIAFLLAPVLSRTMGKKRGAMIIGTIAFLGAPLPIVLRLLGLLPPNGDPFVFWFVLSANVIDLGLIITFQILVASMVADVVEQSELKTGVRSEGVFTAASTFVRKCTQGLGLMAASFVLAAAQFKSGADASQVSDSAIWRMGAYYVPTILLLWFSMMVMIAPYKIDRETHDENLRKLAVRKNELEKGTTEGL